MTMDVKGKEDKEEGEKKTTTRREQKKVKRKVCFILFLPFGDLFASTPLDESVCKKNGQKAKLVSLLMTVRTRGVPSNAEEAMTDIYTADCFCVFCL